MTKQWIKYGKQHLEGRTIKEVRYLTPEEANNMGWAQRSIVLVLDNGTMVFPSRDDEGNDAGTLFGQDSKGKSLTFPVLR